VKVISFLGVTVFPLLDHDQYSVHSWTVGSLLIHLWIDSIVTCHKQWREFGKITVGLGWILLCKCFTFKIWRFIKHYSQKRKDPIQCVECLVVTGKSKNGVSGGTLIQGLKRGCKRGKISDWDLYFSVSPLLLSICDFLIDREGFSYVPFYIYIFFLKKNPSSIQAGKTSPSFPLTINVPWNRSL
jgi:hypothetical protein